MADQANTVPAAGANTEAIEAWDGPLYDRFVRFREVVTTGLAAHGEVALHKFPSSAGQRVLDIGCGFGDTRHPARLVGPGGEAVGVDASPRFIETAVEEAQAAGVENARLRTLDVEVADLGGPYDLAFSRPDTWTLSCAAATCR